MARVLIDGRFVGVGESISRYTLELLKHILKIDRKNEYTLLVRPLGEEVLLANYPDLIEVPNLQLSVLDVKHYSLDEQTKLLAYLNEEKFDLVHFTQFNHPIRYKRPFVITIHDLTIFHHNMDQGWIKRMAFSRVMKSAVGRSSKIITVSDTTKRELVERYGISGSKVAVIYNGIDHSRYNKEVKSEKKRIDDFRTKYQIAEPYILYTGMWKQHKNLVRLLRAFENTYETEEMKGKVQLVLVGKVDDNEREVLAEIERINKKYGSLGFEAVRVTGYVDEWELPLAYAEALAYVIPSLSEGFGMPPLEAMACGTPVIASNASCIPEVLGDAPLYFNPKSEKEMSEAMAKMVKDGKLRDKLREQGLKQAQKYRWDEAAKEIHKIYRAVLQ
ncbi:MAG: Mannosylfructose-phosphate synthase [bacterium ADurb.Bin400]|nr:MAG: Mannosylfructose-phosphate synthase [bacterium ADurb.Bin400]